MSDAPATYTPAPPRTAACCAGCAGTPGPACTGPEPPALLPPARLDELAHALAAEREDCASEPANALGYWPAAVAGLLAHVAAARPGFSGSEAPAPPLLSAERLAEIAAFAVKCRAFQQQYPGFDDEHRRRGHGANGMVNDTADLLGHIVALSDAAQIVVEELRAENAALLADAADVAALLEVPDGGRILPAAGALVSRVKDLREELAEAAGDLAALLTNANAWQARAETAERRAEALTNYIRAAEQARGQQDTAYVAEATRLLKQCRRPELAAAVELEMSSHGSALGYLALTQARAEKADARAAEQQAELDKTKDRIRELLAEFYAGGALLEQPAPPFGPLPPDLIAGVNNERQRNNAWVALKCRELGVPFPPTQAPHPGFVAKDSPAAL